MEDQYFAGQETAGQPSQEAPQAQVQPQADYGQQFQNEPMPAKPGNNLALAIFTTVCCCLPFGIVGIVYAAKVNGLYLSKQYAAAQQAADNAKKWSLIGIGIGVAIDLIYGALYGAGLVAGLG